MEVPPDPGDFNPADIYDPEVIPTHLPDGIPHNSGAEVWTKREWVKASRQKLLGLVAEGKSVNESLNIVGIEAGTLFAWRKDPEFQQAWLIAKKRGREQRDLIKDPYNIHKRSFSWKRKKFFDRKTPDYQRTFVDVIENAQPGEISLILCPPGIGKTLTIEDWISIAVGEDPNLRILYISETDSHPHRIVRHLRQRMDHKSREEFLDYHVAYGPFMDIEDPRMQKWTENELTVVKCTRDEHTPTFYGTGWSGQIASLRADVIILDDMQTQATLGLTDKMMERLQGTIISRTRSASKPKIIMIAQRVGVNDLAGNMIKEGMVKPQNIVKMPLCNDEYPDRSQFYPYITHEEVAEIKRMSSRIFETMYQQNPEASRDMVFSEALEEFWDDTMSFRDPLPFREWGTVTTVDPATVGGSAIITASFDENDIVVRDLYYKFDVLQISKLENELIAQVIRWGSRVVIVEAQAVQTWLATSDRLIAASKKYGFKIVHHRTNRNKFQGEFSVAQMEFPMRMGGIKAPGRTPLDREKFGPLADQLSTWRPDKNAKVLVQDCVMALWFAWYWIVRYRRGGGGPMDYSLHPEATIPRVDPRKILKLPYKPTRL